MIAAWHTEVANHKLRKERKVESEEHQDSADLTPDFVVHPASHLRPPEVQPSEEAHRCTTNHDVVEVRDNKVGCSKVDVRSQGRQVETSQSTDGKQPQEAECVQHMACELNRALVHRRRPVKDLHCRRDSNEEAEDGEDKAKIHRL